MGLFLSNIHIKRKSEVSADDVRVYFLEEMISKGYTQLNEPDDAELRIAIWTPKNSSWITVASDHFNFDDNNDTRVLAEPLSKRFSTSVIAMACIDSDYAFMHLIDTSKKTDGWINSGSPYEGMKLPRRTSVAPWKSVVSNYERFKQSIREKRTAMEIGSEDCYNKRKLWIISG